ncbi:hypothetical protein EHR_00680 [Enterococcus hirae ATCC 9790]|uniref:Uncharacterized protein n=1 Tax=Enterococcus hirae (strain ATCC 9790 / DSM 20160 / JCM 8729 / LMG 6399 / NBRC 3181 / NCIMB 6459 / NCDO 1258 / NCTC 12367 / WDCM 00089 / R) TaxID=768486 RepID=I6RXT6_ENTHA|nr:hypothetical protein EHR_00680 [Enterococcus hirae ATCC 9790]
MRNYWYVSLSNRYPQPNDNDPIRVVQSVQIKRSTQSLKWHEKRHQKKSTNITFVTVDVGIGKTNIFNKTLRGTSNE